MLRTQFQRMTHLLLSGVYVLIFPMWLLMVLFAFTNVFCQTLLTLNKNRQRTRVGAPTNTITKTFEFCTQHEFVKQFYEWLTIELDDQDIKTENSNFLTMDVVDSRSEHSGMFTIVLVLRREWFAGPYTSTGTLWSSILTETHRHTNSNSHDEEVPYDFLIKTHCMNPKTRQRYSHHGDERVKRDKVFFCLAENLYDYVSKVRRGVISYATHTSLWLTILSKERRWFNHNKDVPFLHFKFVDKDGPRPPLFEHTCPRGEAITETRALQEYAPLHATTLFRCRTTS